jgi:hypothetical protein
LEVPSQVVARKPCWDFPGAQVPLRRRPAAARVVVMAVVVKVKVKVMVMVMAQRPPPGSEPGWVATTPMRPEAPSPAEARTPCWDLPDALVPLWRSASVSVAVVQQRPFEPEAAQAAARLQSPVASSLAAARTPCSDCPDAWAPVARSAAQARAAAGRLPRRVQEEQAQAAGLMQ